MNAQQHVENLISEANIHPAFIVDQSLYDELWDDENHPSRELLGGLIDDGCPASGNSLILMNFNEGDIGFIKSHGGKACYVAELTADNSEHELFEDEDYSEEADLETIAETIHTDMVEEYDYMWIESTDQVLVVIEPQDYHKYDVLAVMTVPEVASHFNITERGVHKAIERQNIPARQSGATWLLSRSHVEGRWGEWYYILSDYIPEKQSPSYHKLINMISKGKTEAYAYADRLKAEAEALDMDPSSIRVATEAETLAHFGITSDAIGDLTEWCDYRHPETGRIFERRADYNYFEAKYKVLNK